jgi:hypothetical protein
MIAYRHQMRMYVVHNLTKGYPAGAFGCWNGRFNRLGNRDEPGLSMPWKHTLENGTSQSFIGDN